MKKHLDSKQHDVMSERKLLAELQELIDHEIEACERLNQLRKTIGNYDVLFLFDEIDHRDTFLQILVRK